MSTAVGAQMRVRDRLVAWIVTGPVGRLVAFVADFAVVAVRGAINKVGRR